MVEPFFAKIEGLSRIQRLLIYFGTITVLLGVSVYGIYMPKKDKVDSLQKKYDNVYKKLKVAKKNASELKEFKKRRKRAEDEFKIAKSKLPETQEIPSLLSSISLKGQEAGLDFLLFQPKAERVKDFYAEIPVAIKVLGSYHNVATFFSNVAKLPRIVNVQGINITPGKGGKQLTTSCTAVTYKFVEKPKNTGKKTKKGKKSKKRKRK